MDFSSDDIVLVSVKVSNNLLGDAHWQLSILIPTEKVISLTVGSLA